MKKFRSARRQQSSRPVAWLSCAIILWFCASWPVSAGFYYDTVSPGNVPWPGGVVPYVIDPALSSAQQQIYLDGLREWELAANVHFIPRTTETQYVLFKYDPAGPNLVSGSNPQVVEINLLTRGQICHEMGHSFGLQHEHVRGDRNIYVNVLSANITSGNEHFFNIDPNATTHDSYDFESVMHFARDVFSVQPGVLDTLQARPGFERFQPRMNGLALSKGDRAVMKFLYGAGPTLSPVVTNTSEGGVGSLRAALHYATDNPGTTITFNIPTTDPGYADGVFTIRRTGFLLPFIVDGTTIDGTTQPGYTGSPLIVLDGSQLLPEAGAVPGLLVYAANCTIRGLSFQLFPWVGLEFLFADAHHNTVRACWFGLNDAGTASAPNAFQGIYIFNGSYSNTIGGTTAADRNVISGNKQYGIWMSGPNVSGNVVQGNYIGTGASGLAAVPNGSGGLIVFDGSHHNTIGGTSAGARNVISGNTDAGIWLTGAGVDNNTVRGNYIGLAATGTAAVPNTFAGLNLLNGAEDNLVADNVISGNATEGLRIADPGTAGNVVQGNYIGTAPGGNGALGNGFVGLAIYGAASGNLIGGTTAAARNIISGNGTVGLVFGDPDTANNIAHGNFIGTNAAGNASVPNGFAGVYIVTGADENQLGGVQPGTGNLISGNGGFGVLVADPGTEGNLVRGNLIGTNATGTAAVANAFSGLSLFNGAQNNVIGGSAGARNVISGNANFGIVIADSATNSNRVQGNTIGRNLTADAAIPNAFSGIAIFSGANANTIGGNSAGVSNLISGNGGDGVQVADPGTVGNAVRGNSIFGNSGSGIALFNGGNTELAAPVLDSAVLDTALHIQGTLPTPAGTFRIEFFFSPTLHPFDLTEGRTFLGGIDASGGGAAFNATLPAIVPAGHLISATATDSNGNTSQFSAPLVVTSNDTDSDGIPDSYETAHGLNPNVNDAGLDADGDGLTNLQEFLAGTDPQVAASRFRFLSLTRTADDLALTFSSVPGRTYRIEAKDDWLLPGWTLLEGQVLAVGTSTQIIDFGGAVLPRRFYRAAIEP